MLPLKYHLLKLIGRPPQHWWIEITTTLPRCIYFFGPFDSFALALDERDGYIDDLVAEKAYGITVKIERCQPNLLTIFEMSESIQTEDSNSPASPAPQQISI